MDLTDEHRNALLAYLCENDLSREDFARNFGVTEATVSRWISGQIVSIKHKNWLKLEVMLRKHLNVEPSLSVNEDQVSYNAKRSKRTALPPSKILNIGLNTLSDEEKRLVSLFRSLPQDAQNRILDTAVSETTSIIKKLS